MKRKPVPKSSITVFRLWQYLEFFQWFSKEFNAVRTNDFQYSPSIKNTVTAKVTPSGVGLSYTKHRGTEIIINYKRYERLYATLDRSSSSIEPTLQARIDHWRTYTLSDLDFRQITILAAILAYQPNNTPPARR